MNNNDTTPDKSGRASWKTEENLRELYVRRGLSMGEIAQKYDCSTGTVYHWIQKFDIQPRSYSESGRGKGTVNRAYFETRSTGYERWAVHIPDQGTVSVFVHRLACVAEYGFDQVVDMDVHHKNNIGWDNRPDNLELLSHEDHMSLHAAEQGGDGDV